MICANGLVLLPRAAGDHVLKAPFLVLASARFSKTMDRGRAGYYICIIIISAHICGGSQGLTRSLAVVFLIASPEPGCAFASECHQPGFGQG